MKTHGAVSRVTGGTRENIKAIRDIEREAHRDTTLTERIGATIVRSITQPAIIVLHAVGVLAWIAFNRRSWAGFSPVDPFPCPMLALAMSLEAIVLAIVILLNQRRQTRVEEHFEHLNLQITLLAEQETTKILQSLSRICEHLHIPNSAADDAEVREMIEKIPIAELAKELKKTTTPTAGLGADANSLSR